jgi:hypothetical protein
MDTETPGCRTNDQGAEHMTQRQEGLPATSLFLLAAALLLFGIGGGLVGYMVGERHGEQRAGAIIATLGDRWETLRGDSKSRFDGAIASVAAQLEKGVADIKAEVSMYHGCGAICNVIAYQFGEDILHTRDAVKETAAPTLPSWGETLEQSDIPLEAGTTPASSAELSGTFSKSTVIVGIALLCATVALCFGFACLTVLRLRTSNQGPA